MTCKPFISADGARGIMCRRGFVEKPSKTPDDAGVPSPDLRPGFPLGQRVKHKVFGVGRITKRCVSRDPQGLGDKATIAFDAHGTKEFCVTFVRDNLKPMDAP